MHGCRCRRFIPPAGISICCLLVCLACLACNWGGGTPASGEKTVEQVAADEILWDTAGVPHIFARSSEKLFFAHGWAQAKAHGRRLVRRLDRVRQRAAAGGEDELATLDRALRTDLDAFARGINAYYSTNPEALDPEAAALLPVAARDVLHHLRQLGARRRAGPELPWLEVHLVSPHSNVHGVAVLGLPFVGLAWQQQGWHLTLDSVDSTDLRSLLRAAEKDALAAALQPLGDQLASPVLRSRTEIEAHLARRELM